jgi:hypothetical protein
MTTVKTTPSSNATVGSPEWLGDKLKYLRSRVTRQNTLELAKQTLERLSKNPDDPREIERRDEYAKALGLQEGSELTPTLVDAWLPAATDNVALLREAYQKSLKLSDNVRSEVRSLRA